MSRVFRCNLHLHTCLSPCGDLDMHPQAVVDECIGCGLDIIAVTDHNASENVIFVQRAAAGSGLVVLPGMELCTREEVHILAIFERLENLQALQGFVYENLRGRNDERAFGVQAIVNEFGEVEGFNDHLLIGATDIPIDRAVDMIHSLGGLAIASHIDRQAFGIIGQLGFVPREVQFDALEVSMRTTPEEVRRMYPDIAMYTIIKSSDAHTLDHIATACTRMLLEEPCFQEVKMALGRQGGRYCLE